MVWPGQAGEAVLRSGRQRVADGTGALPAWNHQEFAVPYPSLDKQLCVGGIYIRLLVDGADKVLARGRLEASPEHETCEGFPGSTASRCCMR